MDKKLLSIKLSLGTLTFLFFLVVLSIFAAPMFRNSVVALGITFSLVGGFLVFLTQKKKIQGLLKIFLLLSGGGAAGFFISVLLHNLIYGLLVFLFGEKIWQTLGTSDEPVFFFLAILVCPLIFVIGTIGSATLLIRDDLKKSYDKYRETNQIDQGRHRQG